MKAVLCAAMLLVLSSCTFVTYLPSKIGEKYYEEGDYENAIRLYLQAIADRDQRPETFYWLGMSYYRHGDLEEAMFAFEKSLEKDSTDVVVMERLAAVNLDLGHLESARYYCAKSIRQYDGYMEAFNTMGHIYFQMGELDSAGACFRHVLTTSEFLRLESLAQHSFVSYDEEKAEANNGLGEICIARGLMLQALDYFTKANTLAHYWETPWFNKGRAYEALGNTKAAEVAYQRTIELAPSNTVAYKNLARMYQRLGRESEARRMYQRAIYSDSLDVECYLGLAQLYEDSGDKFKAASLYADAVRKGPDEPKAYASAGRVNMLLGNFRDAEDYFGALVQLQPDKPEWHNAYGEASQAAGDTTEAVQSFEASMALDSLYTPPMRNLGSLLLKQGREAEGLRYILRAAQIGDSKAADVLRQRGVKWE
jgi:tetratricopeptide (TPR) repeat protein